MLCWHDLKFIHTCSVQREIQTDRHTKGHTYTHTYICLYLCARLLRWLDLCLWKPDFVLHLLSFDSPSDLMQLSWISCWHLTSKRSWLWLCVRFELLYWKYFACTGSPSSSIFSVKIWTLMHDCLVASAPSYLRDFCISLFLVPVHGTLWSVPGCLWTPDYPLYAFCYSSIQKLCLCWIHQQQSPLESAVASAPQSVPSTVSKVSEVCIIWLFFHWFRSEALLLSVFFYWICSLEMWDYKYNGILLPRMLRNGWLYLSDSYLVIIIVVGCTVILPLELSKSCFSKSHSASKFELIIIMYSCSLRNCSR